jgi:hypothetical protein
VQHFFTPAKLGYLPKKEEDVIQVSTFAKKIAKMGVGSKYVHLF